MQPLRVTRTHSDRNPFEACFSLTKKQIQCIWKHFMRNTLSDILWIPVSGTCMQSISKPHDLLKNLNKYSLSLYNRTLVVTIYGFAMSLLCALIKLMTRKPTKWLSVHWSGLDSTTIVQFNGKMPYACKAKISPNAWNYTHELSLHQLSALMISMRNSQCSFNIAIQSRSINVMNHCSHSNNHCQLKLRLLRWR